MNPDDIALDVNFRNRPANARGIRIATIRFGIAFWVFVMIVAAFIIGATSDVSRSFLLYRFVDFVSLSALALGLSYLIFMLHERSVRRRTSEDSLPLLMIAAFLLSVVLAALWAGFHALYPAIAAILHLAPMRATDLTVYFGAALSDKSAFPVQYAQFDCRADRRRCRHASRTHGAFPLHFSADNIGARSIP